MYILQLNPITANSERVVPVACSESSLELRNFLKRESVEPYRENGFLKSFRKGSILENFNPPDQSEEAWIGVPAIADIGTEQDWANQAVLDYQSIVKDLVAIDDQ